VLATRVNRARAQTTIRALLLLSALLVAGGCGAASGPIEHWALDQGGVVRDAQEQGRAELALARLKPLPTHRLSVAVLASESPGAYCWPSGQVFVTRGLVDLADDDELAAAIAHEVGHLLVDSHLPPPAALDGRRGSSRHAPCADAELSADLAARQLLSASAVSSAALPRLLDKIARHAATTPSRRADLERRIARLAADERP